MFLLCDIEGRRSQLATSEQTLGYAVGWGSYFGAAIVYARTIWVKRYWYAGMQGYWYAVSVFAMSASVFPSSARLNSTIDPRPRL
jgi:hypothetical protein